MAAAMIVRAARRDEVPAIVRMLADDTLGQSRERLEAPLPQAYYDAYEAMAHNPDNRLMVAEVDGEIVGCLQLVFIRGIARVGAETALIESVRIARDRRGRGLGRALIGQVIEIARRRGCAAVELSSHTSRRDAHRFYEGLGFVGSHLGMKLMLTGG